MNNATRILILEDNSSDYELAQREILKSLEPCQFEGVDNRADFLQKLESFQPDIILSDYNLPAFDGMQALALVQKHTPAVPVIIWTGARSEDVAVECMKQGACNYILKENLKRLGPAVAHAVKERTARLEQKQAEAKFASIFENSPVGIFQSTPEGRFLRVNPALARIYGYNSAQEMIESITNIAGDIYLDPKQRDEFTQPLRANGIVQDFEMQNRRKDGSLFWTSTSARVVHDEAGNLLYYEGFLQEITARKLGETKLQESETRYRGIFESAQDAILIESTDNDILDVNPRACEMFGYTRDEFLKKKVIDIVPSERSIFHFSQDEEFLGETIETINVRANGEHFPVELRGGLFPSEDHDLIIIILREITERKEAEEKLRRQEKRFRALIENALDNISLLAKDGTLLWENPAANRTLGYDQDAFVNRNIFELMHPEDLSWTSELFAKIAQEPGSQQHGIFRLKHANGTWRWIDATATNMLNEASVAAVVINYRDITDRKQAEEELRESQTQYRNLVETSHDLIWAVDVNGCITFINHAAEDIYGYKPQELIGHSFLELMDSPASYNSPELLQQLMANVNEFHEVESPVKHKDGRRLILSTNSIVNRDADGKAIGIFGSSRDITERKSAEDKLRDSEERYRLLFESNPLPMWIYDLETLEFLKVNDAAIDHYGYSAQEFLSMTIKDIRPAEDVSRLLANIAESKTENRRVDRSGIWRHLKKDGTMILVDMRSHPVDFAGRKAELVLATDVTGQKQAEAEIQQKNDDLALINTLNQVINLGQGLGAVVGLMKKELKRIFSSEGVTIFMLSPDKQFLKLQEYQLAPTLARMIEKLIGRNIPPIEVALPEGSYFTEVLQAKKAIATSDPAVIESWMEELATTPFLSKRMRGPIRRLIPRIRKLLNIKSNIQVPLVWEGESIGLLNITGRAAFSAEDLRRIETIAGHLTLAIRRSQMEDLIKSERNLLRTLIDNLPDRIYVLDREGRKTLANTADWQASGGKRMEDIIGKTDLEMYPAELAEQFWRRARLVMETGVPLINDEEPGLDSAGNQISILSSKIPLRDEEGKVVGLVGIGHDITERKQAEAQANELLVFNEKILNNSPVGILTYKTTGKCVFANEQAASIVGGTVEQLKAQNFRTIPSWKKSGLYDLIEQAIAFQTPVSADIHHFSTFGKAIWMTAHCTTFTSKGEEHVLLSFIDITERKQAVEKIRIAGEFLQGVQDSLSAHVAILDQTGVIVQVNTAWRTFGEQNGLQHPRYGLGVNYLDVCEAAEANVPEAGQVACAIRDILAGKIKQASIEYACHRPGELRWFVVQITCFDDGEDKWVILAHENITERKQAEESVRAEREKAQNYLDIVEVMMLALDREGKITLINQKGCEILGYSYEEVIGRNWIDNFIPETIRPDIRLAFRKQTSGNLEDISYYENPVLTKTGEERLIAWHNTLLRDSQGTLISTLSSGEDITERKQAEMELVHSQARYQSIFDSSPISLWEEDYSLVKRKIEELQQGGVRDVRAYFSAHPQVLLELASLIKVTNVNRASLDLYHVRHKEELLVNLFELSHQLHNEATLQYLQDEILGLMSPAARFSWEGEDKTMDGQGLIVLVNGSIPPGYEETWSKVIVSVADITERKRAEEALRESEERFSSAFESAPIGIALVSLDGHWIKVNQALCDLLGYTKNEFVEKTFQEITYPDDLNADLEYVDRILSGKQTGYQMEKRYFHKAGNIVWALLSVSLVKDAQGRPQYFISQIQDITQRKQAEDEIRRRAQETAALLETSLALTNLDLNAILQTIGNSAKNLFAADGCRLFLMQPDRETLRCVLALQENSFAFSDLRVKLGDGVTGAVAASGQAEIVNEMHNDPRAVQVAGTPDREEEAIMFAPLKERDHTVGVISVRRVGTERPFKKSDLELLEAFASMAASAVLNARLFEEIQRRLSELEALYKNGLAVGQLLEPAEIGARIIETFARHLSWHHVTIRLLRPGTDELELIAFNIPKLREGEKRKIGEHFNRMIPRVGIGLSGWVVQTGLPVRTGNVHLFPQYINTQEGIASGLYMPLRIGARIIGVISVESTAPDAFTEQDERLLATLANQAAVAFENARLYQAAQQEILERNRAQQALLASEVHYRELADSITDIMFELDQDLRYTHWNKASEKLTGIPTQAAIGKSMREIFGKTGDMAAAEEVYECVLRERQARTIETQVPLNGQKRTLEINAYPSARGVSVVAKDITERKLSEALLQKRLELMEYSTHHSFEGLLQKTIDEVSAMTESHVGFLHFVEQDERTITRQIWSTETMRIAGHMDWPQKHLSLDKAGVWADAVRQRQCVIHNDYASLPNKVGLPEGHFPLIREVVIPITRNEKVVAVLGIGNKDQEYTPHDIETAERFADYAWDIVERKLMETILADERNQLAKRVEERTADLSRANSNLARALRVKDEFLANMSHELRTPLNAILGLSESLGEQVAGPLNEKQQKYLATINESGHHLLSLINDILDLAKIEAGQITLDINKVDVNAVCQGSLRMIKQLAQKKHQDVQFEIDPDMGLMWADERRLKQMLVNLLSNAVKFTPDGGRLGLEVHGDRLGNRVVITVWDNGIGISEQDLARLFKPFVQLDSSLAREATGTGLGLALVAQMARLHGGGVSVDSRVGAGSRFSVQLPWERAFDSDAAVRLRNTGKFSAINPKATLRPTILIIEDTREVVMMLADYLEMAGFQVVSAQDGVEGLEQAKLAHPDVILMDVMMPRMDGFEATQKFRMDPEFRDTPIIGLTALAMATDRQRCLEVGMNEYVSKPVNLRALVKMIRKMLFEDEEIAAS